MAKVGDSANTSYGPGKIIEVDSARGRSSYRVAGRGFNVWVDATKIHVASEGEGLFSYAPMLEYAEEARKAPQYSQGYGGEGEDPELVHFSSLDSTIEPASGGVNEDNYATLPYNPSPQYPVDLFADECTIQPGEYQINADDRLHPSQDGTRKTSPKGPQPSRDLFAWHEGDPVDWSNGLYPMDPETGEDLSIDPRPRATNPDYLQGGGRVPDPKGVPIPDYPMGPGYDRPGFGHDDVAEYEQYLDHHGYDKTARLRQATDWTSRGFSQNPNPGYNDPDFWSNIKALEKLSPKERAQYISENAPTPPSSPPPPQASNAPPAAWMRKHVPTTGYHSDGEGAVTKNTTMIPWDDDNVRKWYTGYGAGSPIATGWDNDAYGDRSEFAPKGPYNHGDANEWKSESNPNEHHHARTASYYDGDYDDALYTGEGGTSNDYDWAPGYTPDEQDIHDRSKLKHPESGTLEPGESWGHVSSRTAGFHEEDYDDAPYTGEGGTHNDDYYGPDPRYRDHPDSWDHQPTQKDYDEWDARHPELVREEQARREREGSVPEVSERDEPGICPCGKHYITPGFTHKDWEEWMGQADKDYFVPDPEEHVEKLISGSYRPAGLSDRYAHIIESDNGMDPISQFRRDPVGYINLVGHMWTDGDDSLEKYADYTQLIDVDPTIREAAWSDVRQKAMRLRHEGRVHVNDMDTDRIYATVEGDHGTYDTMIAKGGSMGGFGGGQSITNWNCSCDWGRWAFKRQFTYVGRLCSHAYAAYLDMQSQAMKDNPIQKKYNPGAAWAKAARVASVVDDYKKWLKDNYRNPGIATVTTFARNIEGDPLGEQDIQSLYDWVAHNPTVSPDRDYDIDYTEDPSRAFKQQSDPPDEAYLQDADVLHTQPRWLSPTLRHVQPSEEDWTDVTKDDRETTGPDQIVKKSYLNTLRLLHGGEGVTDFSEESGGYAPTPGAPSTPDPSSAGTGDDDDSGAAPAGGEGSGFQTASLRLASDEALLDKLRELSTTPASDDLGHMDDHNEELRDVVDELQDRGYDASFMVAAAPLNRNTVSPDGSFQGESRPGWADAPFSGSGPDPKDWASTSKWYLDEVDQPDYEDVTDVDGTIKNGPKPQQGPKKSSRRYADNFSSGAGMGGSPAMASPIQPDEATTETAPNEAFDSNSLTASLHMALDDNDSGYFGGGGATADDWENASGEPFMQEVQKATDEVQKALPSGPGKPKSPGDDDDADAGEGAEAGADAGEAAGAIGDVAEVAPLLATRGVKRAGRNPAAQIRVDPGARQPQLRQANGWGNINPSTGKPFEPGWEDEWETTDGGPRYEDPYAEEPEIAFADIPLGKKASADGSDIVAAFQRSAGAAAVMGNSSGGDDDIAARAQAFLRTAGRKYSPDEQRELEAEFHPQGARNLPTEDELRDTHYALGF